MGMKISEMITDRYKLRIPPTVYYNLLADVQEMEEEQEPTTKNDLGVDCIDRKELIDWINIWDITPVIKKPLIRHIQGMPSVTPQFSSGLEKNSKKLEKDFGESDCISREATVKRLCNLAEYMNEHKKNSGNPYIMAALFIQDNKTEFPSVTPQEPQSFKWCTDCKEYDQEKHCCHRWSKVIRDTVEEMKQEQEPRWIPVSERLPEENICDDGYHEPSELILAYMKSGEMHVARYWSRYDYRWLGIITPTTDEVIAWMPLPKPYEPQESEDKESAHEENN